MVRVLPTDPQPDSLLPDLSIDAMDVAGEQQLDVEHNLFKKRLDKDGVPVSSEAERHGNGVEQLHGSGGWSWVGMAGPSLSRRWSVLSLEKTAGQPGCRGPRG